MLAIIVWTIRDIVALSFVVFFCFVLLGIYLSQLVQEWIKDFRDKRKGKKARCK